MENTVEKNSVLDDSYGKVVNLIKKRAFSIKENCTIRF